MYIRLSDNQYPLSEQEIRAANPDTVFADPFNPDGYDWVFPTPQPTTTRLQVAREIAPVLDPVKLTWGQVWEVVDITVGMTAEQISALKETILREKLSGVESMHQQKLYSDIAVSFPSGTATIQFRNEIDRTNLSNISSAAMALVIGGTPTEVIPYRTLDNTIQQVPASTMISIAMSVMAAKQAVVDVAWSHKDNINALGLDPIKTPQDAVDYDITAGW